MFSNHLPPQLIELLVIYSFTDRGASPYGVPATHVQGFARFLQLLFQYDWEGSPLVVDVDDGDDKIDSAAVESAWSKREQDSSAMFVVTNYDLKSVWTQGSPSVHVLKKIKTFARASAGTLITYLDCSNIRHDNPAVSSSNGLKALFQTPINRFDMLIHLRDEVIPAGADALSCSYKKAAAAISAGPLALPAPRAKNLQMSTGFEDQLLSGFSPPEQYVQELQVCQHSSQALLCTSACVNFVHFSAHQSDTVQKPYLQEHFAATAIVFYDSLGGRSVGLSWLPLACVPQRGRSGLKLQMLSDGMLVQIHVASVRAYHRIFMRVSEGVVPDVPQVPSSAADSSDTQLEQTTNATLLIRNMFECVASSLPRALL
jgi:hypothetical protein